MVAAEVMAASNIEDSDEEAWVAEFEAKYGDMCRLPPKEKHQRSISKPACKPSGTPREAAPKEKGTFSTCILRPSKFQALPAQLVTKIAA